MTLLLRAGLVYTGAREIEGGWVLCDGGLIERPVVTGPVDADRRLGHEGPRADVVGERVSRVDLEVRS